jgi:hypothetical protein
MIMPGTQGGGWLITIILGILGAFVGGAIGVYILHWGDVTSFWKKLDSFNRRSFNHPLDLRNGHQEKLIVTYKK